MDKLDLNFLEFGTEFPLRISNDERVLWKPDIYSLYDIDYIIPRFEIS